MPRTISSLAEAITQPIFSLQNLAVLLVLAGLGLLIWGVRKAFLSRGTPLFARQPAAPSAEDQTAELLNRQQQICEELRAIAEKLAADSSEKLARLDRALARFESARSQPAEPPRPPQPASMVEPKRPLMSTFDDDPLHREAYALSDQGMPTVEIARRLERPTGQIELILALRGPRTAST
jgi:hypothetical protein